MFGAGPLASADEKQRDGEGMFIYRASSLDEAHKIAESDPMHSDGARSSRIRSWLLHEGTFSARLYYSGGKTSPRSSEVAERCPSVTCSSGPY
jgi:uncharacterized protein